MIDSTSRQKTIGERAIQKRLFPKPGDRHYLHLADLELAMRKIGSSKPLRILDYGAGNSPYRLLFPQSEYFRADIAAPGIEQEADETPGRDENYPDPDYFIRPDGRVEHESSAFDCLLSTQVLEHVSEPEVYLSEAFRLLKPGGRLLLSTHGSWEDHGCPYDFRRWTADGLEYDLRKAGFDIESMEKLTTGPRALLWFFQLYLSTDRPSRKTPLGLWHWLCRNIPTRWIHLQADRLYPNCRVVTASAPGHRIYLALFACARRPL